MRTEVFRHVCPSNCYSTCGLISRVENGKVRQIQGDRQHGYTKGYICARGQSYIRSLYHKERILYPMLQQPRRSGRWIRIDWPVAVDIMAEKILSLSAQFGSFEPICCYSNSGNISLLHRAWSWLANSLGATNTAGSICWGAGLDALHFDVGDYMQLDPSAMGQTKHIICWGSNPAWTAIHQMDYINQARELGAKLVVIDPVYTATAAQADLYVQIRPGSDGALALGMAKHLYENNLVNHGFVESYTVGGADFFQYLDTIDLQKMSDITGVPSMLMRRLAEEYAAQPAALWIGLGVQRHINGGQNVRCINALSAITGHIGEKGGGVYFANPSISRLLMKHVKECEGLTDPGRVIFAHDLAAGLAKIENPPIKMLILANANPLTQNAEVDMIRKHIKQLDMVVAADLFLTATAREADLFLPVTTFLEHWDLTPSYWHNWLGINQPAISPVGECKSDIDIVNLLVQKLNERKPGSNSFPAGKTEKEWLADIMAPEMCKLLGISDVWELLDGPRPFKFPGNPWEQGAFSTPSGKYELFSLQAQKAGLPPLPVYTQAACGTHKYPYRLLTPHSRDGINSQPHEREPRERIFAYLHPETARKSKIVEGKTGRLMNDRGEIAVTCRITSFVPEGTVVIYQPPAVEIALNCLVPPLRTDMGGAAAGGPAIAYYDTFVNIMPV
ncbi:molybdopterin-dependent oxidoreductase [Acetonema longum]|uniref:Molybdopterin oxidoreductase n=1 Tax=Acetonema longum DSM 6540 TaxID=1009370 RepID=F7NJR8_9FIRM|nr:molybdopterin-dependent oxidoreductase [Acetonema longum]EGO63724.1 molybdopterin oxidoreductase [Acetonema longum DSM 6540]